MTTTPKRVQRFEVIGHLGTGGMGSVYRARDPQLERDVALKLLARPTAGVPTGLSAQHTLDLRGDSPASAEDLLREARMMARLSHPNVLPVYEVGLADDTVFVVMEHIDGHDLRTWLAQPRSTAEILGVFAQAGRGLAAAHARDIIHRDFKPANVLVGSDGRVRVADFGLSRLSAKPSAMRRVAEIGGTPRYMAPELWRGEPATKRSDVFAFSVALAEAFGAEREGRLDETLEARGVAPPLRALIAAGVADDPKRRPELGALVAALDGRPPRRSRVALWLGLGATAAIAAGVGAFALQSSAPACAADPQLAAGRWDDARRQALRHALQITPMTAARKDAIDRIVASADAVQHGIETEWVGACTGRRDGTLTDGQAAVRQSCLVRRELELGTKAAQLASMPRPNLALVQSRVNTLGDPVECRDLAASVLTDRDAAEKLYARFAATEDMADDKTRLPAFEALARDAAAHGDRELEARATLNLGVRQGESGQLADGDATLQHAYALATELRAERLEALALLMRAHNAGRRGDIHEADGLGKLVVALAEKQEIPVGLRARVDFELAHNAIDRNDPQAALDLIDKGLDLIAKDHHQQPYMELSLRRDRARVFGLFEGKRREGLQAARETADWTRATFGEHSSEYSGALSGLASQLQYNFDNAHAVEAAKQSVDIAIETFPVGAPDIWYARGDYALYLEHAARYEEAREIYADELAAMDHIDALRVFRSLVTVRLGVLTCKLGRLAEGIPQIRRGIELATEQYGADHVYTRTDREELLGYELEADDLDNAERTIAELDRGYHVPGDHTRALVLLDGVFRADLLLLRHKPREAEAKVRPALAAWSELKGEDQTRMALMLVLLDALIEQHRWAEARETLATTRTLAKAVHAEEDSMAQLDVGEARIEMGVGHKAAAIALATSARTVLERYPMNVHAMRDIDAILAHHK